MSDEKDLSSLAEKFGVVFDSVVQRFKDSGSLSQVSVIEQYLPQIKEIAASVEKSLGDGFQWTDVIDFFKIVKPLMVLAKDVEGLSGEDKRKFVSEAIWVAYKTYDDGPTGNENNIDIPWLFGPFERKVESIVIPLCADLAVGLLYPEMKERGVL